MRFKAGVPNDTMQPEIFAGAKIAEQVFQEMLEMVITSTTDGKHGENSLHPLGEAIDIRTRYLKRGMVVLIAAEIKRRLPPGYDVVIEKDHLHVEWDPKEKRDQKNN